MKRLGHPSQRQAEKLAVITSSLDDTDELVRIEAAEALGRIRDRQAFPALSRALADPSPLVRSYVAGAIGELGDPTFLPLLRRAAKRERSDTAMVGLLSAMYVLGEDQVVKDLTDLLNSSDYRVRCAVANTLANVVTHPSDVTDTTREALARALSEEPTRAARSSLTRAIHHIDRARTVPAGTGARRRISKKSDRNG